jgi:hypothetical protein
MLSDFQRAVLLHIASETLTVQNRFHDGERVAGQIDVIANYAYALYIDLAKQGNSFTFSNDMRRNRGVPPENLNSSVVYMR